MQWSYVSHACVGCCIIAWNFSVLNGVEAECVLGDQQFLIQFDSKSCQCSTLLVLSECVILNDSMVSPLTSCLLHLFDLCSVDTLWWILMVAFMLVLIHCSHVLVHLWCARVKVVCSMMIYLGSYFHLELEIGYHYDSIRCMFVHLVLWTPQGLVACLYDVHILVTCGGCWNE